MKKSLTVLALALVMRGAAQLSLCAGSPGVLVASNPSGLSNPTYSLLPGPVPSTSDHFTVTPSTTTTYTLYTTGTDQSNNVVTTSTQSYVTVYGLPTFSLVSAPGGFTLGCSSKSLLTVAFVNATTAPPGGGAVSFTVVYPGGNLPNIQSTLSPANIYSLSVPGTYTAVVRDNSNGCDATMPFNVVSNTTAPLIDSVHAPILNCFTPSAVIQAYSGSPNITYMWTIPLNTQFASNTITANTNVFIPTSTLVGTYTMTVQDNSNLCKTSQAVVVKQNLFPPNVNIMATNPAITCSSPSVMLMNGSSSGIPSGTFPTSLPVVGTIWHGPSPSVPLTSSSSYVALYPGSYTLTVTDQNNGCTSVGFKMVLDNRDYAVVTPMGPVDLCAQTTATIAPSISTNTTGLTYSWAAPVGANTGPTNGPALVTDALGTYTLTVTTQGGCVTTETFEVAHCTALGKTLPGTTLSIFPNPSHGFFVVSGEEGKILSLEVYDSKMSLVKALKSGHDGTVDLTELSNGIYFIRIAGEAGIKRIVKE